MHLQEAVSRLLLQRVRLITPCICDKATDIIADFACGEVQPAKPIHTSIWQHEGHVVHCACGRSFCRFSCRALHRVYGRYVMPLHTLQNQHKCCQMLNRQPWIFGTACEDVLMGIVQLVQWNNGDMLRNACNALWCITSRLSSVAT